MIPTGLTATTSTRIFNAIKQSCLSIEGVKEFGLWNNQVSKLKAGDKNPVRFPAIFVQFENQYNQLSAARQEIDGTFILYICLQSLKHKDEDILLFKDYVYQQLAKHLPKNGFQDFYRVFELQDTDHDNLIIWQQEYSYSYIDDTAIEGTTIVNPFKVELNVDTTYILEGGTFDETFDETFS